MSLRRALKHTAAPLWVFAGLCVLLTAALALWGWTTTWSALGVATLSPPFADLRTVQAGLGTAARGLDPQVTNPGDPWQRPMNYPSVWLAVARLLHWENETRYLAFCTAMAAGFAACCLDLVRRGGSWWVVLGAASGASLLLVERGNNDGLVFILLYLGAVIARPAFVLLVPLAALLKLYPVVALPAFARRPALTAGAGLLSLAAIGLLLPELHQITAATPVSPVSSYGLQVYALGLQEIGLSAGPVQVGLILAAAGLVIARPAARLEAQGISPALRRLFLCGAAVHVGTAVIGVNWDYRLSFLLMCLPLSLAAPTGWAGRAVPVLVVIAANQPLLTALAPYPGWYANLAAKAALLPLLCALSAPVLLAELPPAFAARLRRTG